MRTRVATDTATIVVFDPACLRHRLNEAADWWSIPSKELAEVNAGNAAFFNLGADGIYELEVVPSLERPSVTVLVRNTSGRFFLGAGEYVSSGGFEPEAEYGNVFLEARPGTYAIAAKMSAANYVLLSIALIDSAPANAFADLVRLQSKHGVRR